MEQGNPYDHPYLTVCQSGAVPRGTGVRFGDKIFLNPADAAKLRSEAMSNDKYEATFGRQAEPTKREVRRAARKARTRRLPLAAKIGAALVLVLLLVVLPVSCAVNGAAYDACIQKIAQEDGHEQAKLAQAQGECR